MKAIIYILFLYGLAILVRAEKESPLPGFTKRQYEEFVRVTDSLPCGDGCYDSVYIALCNKYDIPVSDSILNYY